MFGIPFQPESFVNQAMKVGHPKSFDAPLPEALQVAVGMNANMTAGQLAEKRANWLARWTAVAQELMPEEEKLKKSMSPHAKLLLRDKRLQLWRKMLADARYPDVSVVDEMMQGTDLVGEVELTGLFLSLIHISEPTRLESKSRIQT